MRLRTVVWVAILGACVAGTVYEAPNIMRNLRYLWNTHASIWERDAWTLPKRMVATDPEAADILQYNLDNEGYGADTWNLPRLRDLLAKYPNNEYLLSKLAQGWAEVCGIPGPRRYGGVSRPT